MDFNFCSFICKVIKLSLQKSKLHRLISLVTKYWWSKMPHVMIGINVLDMKFVESYCNGLEINLNKEILLIIKEEILLIILVDYKGLQDHLRHKKNLKKKRKSKKFLNQLLKFQHKQLKENLKQPETIKL